ncbi:winged helix-turn-helix transcriptional regulator [Microbacteriaceae bacterium VKM Ac-2855]|nr:winged helix-turn-helix transcriptional regulator [Microbacteriaceae bacterium VKM Ac-2855]
MRRAVDEIEYEQMLLTRYSLAQLRTAQELDRSAYILLSRLEAQGPMTVGQLSAALQLDLSTLQRQAAAALRLGLIERTADPAGGLARRLSLSAEGLGRLESMRGRNIDSVGKVMHDWPAEDVESFARLLRRFNENIEDLRGEPWPREI